MKKTKSKISRILFISLLICFCFLFCSCEFGDFIFKKCAGQVGDELGDEISDHIVDHAQNEFDSANNDPLPYNPNGETRYETIRIEDALKEGILNEEKLEEDIYVELLENEKIQAEDVHIEYVSVEIFKDIDDLEDYFVCESNYSMEIDYSFIRQRIAKGASIVISEVIVDVGDLILDISNYNIGEIIKDASKIVIMVGGTTLAAFIGYQIGLAKSLAAGNSYEMAMYDALDLSSKAFYYTAVTCDTVCNAIDIADNVKEIIKKEKKLEDGIKDIIENVIDFEILDIAKDVAVKEITSRVGISEEIFAKVKKGKTYVDGIMAKNTSSFYDAVTKEYLGSVIKENDNSLKFIKKVIPSKIYSKSGNLKYTVDKNNKIYVITETASGQYIKTHKGIVDEEGFVKNNYGQIIDRIDFNTGMSIGNYYNISHILEKHNVTVDVFGNLIDLNTGNKLTEKSLDGAINYFDDSGETGIIKKRLSDGFYYLFNKKNGKVVGKLFEDGRFDPNWSIDLNEARYNVTQTFRKELINYISTHSNIQVENNFPQLTVDQINYIRDFKRIPTSLQIHHCKNVANYPDCAGDISNVVVLNIEDHLKEHGGNLQNTTSNRPACYVDVKKLFGWGN